MTTYKGVDVSHHQKGTINFKKVLSTGTQFVMLRLGYRGYGDGSLNMDNTFRQRLKDAQAAGVKVGAYFFSQAVTVAEGIEEAKFCLNVIGNERLDFPLVIDTELSGAPKGVVGRADNVPRQVRTNIVKAFCDKVEASNFYSAIYCSESWLKSNLYEEQLVAYDKWIAKWSVFAPKTICGIWQNSNKGSIAGIEGRVDTNIAYKDYPSIMEHYGLNNYDKKEPKFFNVVVSNITSGDVAKIETLAAENSITDRVFIEDVK